MSTAFDTFDPSGDPYAQLVLPDPDAPRHEQLVALMPFALVAPSPHNTQPWRWRLGPTEVELWADRSRQLSVSDADGRELVIGCGAALEQLVIAMRAIGIAPRVVEDPDDAPDLLAYIDATTSGPLSVGDRALAEAIPRRRTNRTRYDDRPLPAGLLDELIETASRWEGVHLQVVADAQRDALVELIMRGDRVQMADPRFRRELGSWMRPAHSHARDGMAADLLGQHGIAAEIAPIVVRTFDMGRGQAARDSELSLGSPGLVVVWSETDDEPARLRTGRALARIVLHAREADVWTAYMNQPCELAELRAELRSALGVDGFPQLIIRLGSAEGVRPSARRPLADVLDP